MTSDDINNLNKSFTRTPPDLVAFAQSIQDYFDGNLPFEVMQVRALPAAGWVRIELVSHDNLFTVYRITPRVNDAILAELMRHYLRRIEQIREGEPEEPLPEPEPSRKIEGVENIPLSPSPGGYIYVIRGGDLCKIGVSINPSQRFRTLNSASPITLKFEMCAPHPNMYLGEAILHARYDRRRIKGEWFALTDTDLAEIKEFLMKEQTEVR